MLEDNQIWEQEVENPTILLVTKSNITNTNVGFFKIQNSKHESVKVVKEVYGHINPIKFKPK